MLKRRWMYGMMAAAALAVSGCSDDDDPNDPGDGSLTAQESASLGVALSRAGLTEGAVPEIADLVLAQFDRVGSAGDFDAAGLQLMLVVTSAAGSDTTVSTAVVGWKNFDPAAERVDEALSIRATGDGTTFPASGTFSSETGATIVTHYVNSETESIYQGASGELVLASTSFTGAAEECERPSAGSGLDYTCTVARGDMGGELEFTAPLELGEGDPDFFSGRLDFDVPAVRLTIEVTLAGA